jgi:aromatic ring-opening dioxygenase catalytic subunit (LigB family)
MAPPREEPARWLALADYLRSIPASLQQKPQALLVISAHWERPLATLLMAERPGLLFDYYGFPPETYRLTYPAPGAPALGHRVKALLTEAGIDCDTDEARDYDHGIFVPLKVAFPEADIPILQLSLVAGLDPARHIAIGKALAPLRDENVAIIGSGLSFHNLSALGDPAASAPSEAFDDWLTEILCTGPVSSRGAGLTRWDAAPFARICHPREEHLLPLMVAAGAAAGDDGRHVFSGKIWGKAVSAYQFG